jgi:hypothetical protein
MKSVNKIFEDVVRRVAVKYGKNVSYLFGDWSYISNQLTVWNQSPKTSPLKFPIVCLYSPLWRIGQKQRQGHPLILSLW